MGGTFALAEIQLFHQSSYDPSRPVTHERNDDESPRGSRRPQCAFFAKAETQFLLFREKAKTQKPTILHRIEPAEPGCGNELEGIFFVIVAATFRSQRKTPSLSIPPLRTARWGK